jgi:hypothetical protein
MFFISHIWSNSQIHPDLKYTTAPTLGARGGGGRVLPQCAAGDLPSPSSTSTGGGGFHQGRSTRGATRGAVGCATSEAMDWAGGPHGEHGLVVSSTDQQEVVEVKKGRGWPRSGGTPLRRRHPRQ